jgi:hypothetical protein
LILIFNVDSTRFLRDIDGGWDPRGAYARTEAGRTQGERQDGRNDPIGAPRIKHVYTIVKTAD